jgi:hypothetical protein
LERWRDVPRAWRSNLTPGAVRVKSHTSNGDGADGIPTIKDPAELRRSKRPICVVEIGVIDHVKDFPTATGCAVPATVAENESGPHERPRSPAGDGVPARVAKRFYGAGNEKQAVLNHSAAVPIARRASWVTGTSITSEIVRRAPQLDGTC